MPLTVVTCTGGRPELFALCRRWVLRQTQQPTRWLVTYDYGEKPFAPEADVCEIPASYTVPDNWSAALRALGYAFSLVGDGSDVVVIEDDDWYSADYIKRLMDAAAPAAHQKSLYQFHLPERRFSLNPCMPEPCEGMLAFKGSHLDHMRRWLGERTLPTQSVQVDMLGLAQVKGVGFGLPGRTGQTRKHIPGHRKVKIMDRDPGHANFKKIVGPTDADAYLSLLSR